MHWFLPGANVERPTQRSSSPRLHQAPGPCPGPAEALPTSTSRPRPGRAEALAWAPKPTGSHATRFLSPWGDLILKEELDMMGIKPQDLEPGCLSGTQMQGPEQFTGSPPVSERKPAHPPG